MKKFYSIFILTVFLSLFNNTYAAISTPIMVSGVQVSKPTVSKPTQLDLKKMSVAEIEAKIGHKLTWKQKLAMKLVKKRDEGNAALGFALGFLVGIIGVIIAYVAFKEEPKTIRGAWWGFGASVLLSIIIIVIVLATAASVA